MASIDQNSVSSERLDRWLWAARWFKTRSIAVDAIANGRVEVNGVRAKAAKLIRVGDVVIVRRPPYSHEIIVQVLAARRVSAQLAQAFYSETPESIAAREALGETLALDAIVEDRKAGKLNKKERRQREQFKRSFE